MTVLGETRDALVGAVLVVVDAAKLLVRHLPALLTVFLLGFAAHNAALWAAVLVGRDHGVVASFLLPLAPLSMVVAFVLMLRIAGMALVDGAAATRRLPVLASALIPFLTVYTVTGELTKDLYQFLNESYADEMALGHGGTTALAVRSIAVTSPRFQLLVLAGFVVVRLAIDVLDLEERNTAWALVQVLVEVTWLTLFATYLTNQLKGVRSWAEDLVVLSWVTDAWQAITEPLGPLTDPLRALSGLFADTLDHLGPILFTPVLWLAVGAVVLVGGLPEDRRLRDLTSSPTSAVARRATAMLNRIRARRGGAKLLEIVGSRFADLADGLRVLLRAGLLPVLAFCLVLPLARLAEWGTALAIRAAFGPRDPETMILFSRYPDIVLTAVNTLVVVVVVVAAVDRLLLRDPDRQEEPATLTR